MLPSMGLEYQTGFLWVESQAAQLKQNWHNCFQVGFISTSVTVMFSWTFALEYETSVLSENIQK